MIKLRELTFWLSIFTALTSCKNDKSSNEFKFPPLTDTLKPAEHYYSPAVMTTPQTYVEAVWKFGENIDVNETTTSENVFIDDFNGSDILYKSLREHDGLKLLVDNTKLVSVNLYQWAFPPFLFEDIPNDERPKSQNQIIIDSLVYQAKLKTWKDNQTMVKGYPVYIVNPTNKTIRVEEQDGRLMIIQEAKDKNGNWKPIEFWQFSSCGNSYGGIALKPNSYIFTKIIAYRGEFETTLRLKMLNDTILYYSEPFKGSINLSQMDTTLIKQNVRPHNFFNKEK
jgi:hypothetical protein